MNREECAAKIPDYEIKAEILRGDGWVTYMSEDNWIKKDWIEQGEPYEWMGYSTENAKQWSKYPKTLPQNNRPDKPERQKREQTMYSTTSETTRAVCEKLGFHFSSRFVATMRRGGKIYVRGTCGKPIEFSALKRACEANGLIYRAGAPRKK